MRPEMAARGEFLTDHEKIRELISSYLDGELDDKTKRTVEEHLASCPECRSRMTEEAKALGANAVVSVRFSTSMIMPGAAEIIAYGTAVILE
jgi:uncharacterized protein YbjQ (UPF0145 family)